MRFAPGYLEALRRTAAGRPKYRRDDANGAQAVDVEPMSNQDFAYIAGHTAGGFPFGVTWEEMEASMATTNRSRDTTLRKAIRGAASTPRPLKPGELRGIRRG
jgi:hypothetical protein